MTYGFWADFSMLLLGVISALLILVVLLQRGRGGGLAGAFGGLGGQSAFGTKAGDVFTKITIGLVTVWVLLAGVSGVLARKDSEKAQGLPTTEEVEKRNQDDETGSSMSAVGDTSSEDATTDDDKANDVGSTDDASSTEGKTDSDQAAATDEDAKGDSGAATSEKSEAEAAPADDKGDAEATPSEPETATPDNNG